MNNIEYVYLLTHIQTGKRYVGRTVCPEARERQHMTMLKNGKHPCAALQEDYDKDSRVTFQVIGCAEAIRQTPDLEKKVMVLLRTFDERYGYNFKDPAMMPHRIAVGLPIYGRRRGKALTKEM